MRPAEERIILKQIPPPPALKSPRRSSFLHLGAPADRSRVTSVLSQPKLRRAHDGVVAAEFWLGFPVGTSYLKTTLNSFPPSRSASHEFLMTAIFRLSQLSVA